MDARWDLPYTAADVSRANDRVGSLFSGTGSVAGGGAQPGGDLEIGADFEGRLQHELPPWGHSTGPVPARWKELDPGQQIRYSLPGKAGSKALCVGRETPWCCRRLAVNGNSSGIDCG